MSNLFKRACALWVVALLSASLAVIVPAAPVGAAPGDCVGSVFRDHNADGVRQAQGDPHPNGVDTYDAEPGEAGVVVTAYDDTGAAVGTTTTLADGSFDLSTSVAAGTPIRIEFTWPNQTFLESGPSGADNQSSVQFAEAGNCTLSFGVMNPADYCHSGVFLAVPCYRVGAHDDPDNVAANDAVTTIGFNWGADSHSGGNWPDDWQVDDTGVNTPPNKEVSTGDVGAVWGEAWNRTDEVLFLASYMKAAVDFGPGGPGAIYQVPMDPATGLASGPAVEFVDLADLGFDVCDDPHSTDTDLQEVPSITNEVFQAVANCALGDIDISDDDTTLYVHNLTSRELVALSTADGSVIDSWDYNDATLGIDYETCPDPATDIIPFALEYHDGKLYSGVTCTALSTGDEADMLFYVYEVDPVTGTFTLIHSHAPLDEGVETYGAWVPNIVDLSGNVAVRPDAEDDIGRPQHLLTDIDFYNNNLTLGLKDMTADQFGWLLEVPDLGTGLYKVIVQGDLVCSAFVPDATDPTTGTYQLEDGLECGDRTGSNDVGVWAQAESSATDPEGYEFYTDGGGPDVGTFHHESNLGSSEQIPGFPLVHTQINPAEAFGPPFYFSSNGLVWNNNVDGSAERGYMMLRGEDFQKAGGLGDIEALCEAAPIQIGNYVWFDADGDGVQDPSEAPVVGATVNLYAADGVTLIATAITGPDGSYYFDVDPNTEYKIKMDNPADYAAGGPLEGWSLTQDSGDDDDDADSDAVDMDGFPAIMYTTGSAGQNDHTLDFGFTQAYDLALTKQLADGSNVGSVAPGDQVTFTLTVINQLDTDAANVALVDYVPAGLTLDDSDWTDNGDGTATLNTPIASLPGTTSATVDITFTIDADASGTIDNFAEIAGFTDTEGNPVSDVDSDPDSTPGDIGPVTGDGNNDDNVDGDGTDDEDDHDVASLVIGGDYSIGNQVWFDANNDGIIDPDESPIANVWVELFTDNDNDGVPDDINGDGIIDVNDAVATTGTDANGMYLFDGLPAGKYIVGIPPMEWEPGQPLVGWAPSTPVSTDPNDDVDNDNNGSGCGCDTGYVLSGTVMLGDGEPTGENPDNDPNTADENENLTVDFGFYGPIFDLALMKQLADGTNTGSVNPGDSVSFIISVINQGEVDASNITITDYIPAGLTLNDSDWTDNGDGTASITYTDVLVAGDTISVEITFSVDSDAAGVINNFAEISEAYDSEGNLGNDIDSMPDAANDDVGPETGGDPDDDNVDGNGKAGEDEDDHDVATVGIGGILAKTGTNFTTVLFALGLGLLLMGGLVYATRFKKDQAGKARV